MAETKAKTGIEAIEIVPGRKQEDCFYRQYMALREKLLELNPTVADLLDEWNGYQCGEVFSSEQNENLAKYVRKYVLDPAKSLVSQLDDTACQIEREAERQREREAEYDRLELEEAD